MFEKEAKERARKLEESQNLGIYDNEEDYELDRGWNEGEVAGYEDGFKDGAEFGYSKAKAKIKLLKETHQQSINILTDQIEELRKAKEWHSVKDNLPKEDCEVLIEYGNRNTHVVADWISSTKMFGAFCTDEVKRWKEIN